MTDPKNIPHLIKLIDDDSETVRSHVIKELASFGPNLRQELRKCNVDYSSSQKLYIDHILSNQKKLHLKRSWYSWFNLRDEYQKLEMSLTLLSEYLSPEEDLVTVRELLDDLAFTFQETHRRKDPKLLARFLFEEKGFKGEEEDYYNPQNSNLRYVIEEKKGIPISLASIYMLVGRRLGMAIEGCNFPGHFLTRLPYRGQTVFVDCFSGGQFIKAEDLLQVKEELLGDLDNVLQERVGVETIIKRSLANLIRAYQIEDDEENADLMIELFKAINDQEDIRQLAHVTPEEIITEKRPILARGMIVKHVRYGYRGIIVDVDPECYADDSWYYSNQTQPDRDQPWYHVLVHGSDQVTYVAESNLIIDQGQDKIVHPLLSYFFTREKNGKYIRNDNPWPESDLDE